MKYPILYELASHLFYFTKDESYSTESKDT